MKAPNYLIEQSYKRIPNSMNPIRPALSEEDLQLIRRAFIFYAQNGNSLPDDLNARALLKRILRRT